MQPFAPSRTFSPTRPASRRKPMPVRRFDGHYPAAPWSATFVQPSCNLSATFGIACIVAHRPAPSLRALTILGPHHPTAPPIPPDPRRVFNVVRRGKDGVDSSTRPVSPVAWESTRTEGQIAHQSTRRPCLFFKRLMRDGCETEIRRDAFEKDIGNEGRLEKSPLILGGSDS